MRLMPVAALLAAFCLPLAACEKGPDPKVAAATLSAGEAFLAKNKTAPGVVTLPSGLQYKVVTSGPPGGRSPKVRDEVKVHYEGKLLTGEVFDQKAWTKTSPVPERYAPPPGSMVAAPYGATAIVVRVSDPPGAIPRHVVMRSEGKQDRWTRDDQATIAVDTAMLMPLARLYVVGTTHLVVLSDLQAQIFATR